jgi:hypothetical protein
MASAGTAHSRITLALIQQELARRPDAAPSRSKLGLIALADPQTPVGAGHAREPFQPRILRG